MGKADRAEDPIRGPRPRLCEPREAGDQAYPLPHHPHRPTGRQHRRPHRAVRLEGLCHQRGAKTAVFDGCSLVLRRSLQNDQATLPGLHPENKKRMTDKPTVERILKALSAVSLTIVKNAAGEEIMRRLTPLSGLQEDILQRQGLGTSLYGQLEI